MSQACVKGNEHVFGCSSRLSDLYEQGLLSRDQRSVLADQLDVDDGEVIHCLMVESSDKIVELAGDLLYERNVISNIDGGRGNVLLIEHPDDTDPSANDDIVIETQHNVTRFSVSSYTHRPNLMQDKDSRSDLDQSPDDKSLRSLQRQVSLGRNLNGSHDPPVCRRAYKASKYLQRMRSESKLYSSDRYDESDMNANSVRYDENKAVVQRCNSLPRGLSSAGVGESRRKKRATKYASGLDSSEFSHVCDTETSLDSVSLSNPPILRKTPSGRTLEKKNSLLRRITSFEDETHVVIAIEDVYDDENYKDESENILLTTDKNKSEKRVEDTKWSENLISNKSPGVMKPYTNKISKLWGMSGSAGSNTEFNFDDSKTKDCAESTSDDEVVINYDEYLDLSYPDTMCSFKYKLQKDICEGEVNQKQVDHSKEVDSDGQANKSATKRRDKSKLKFTIGNFKKMFSSEASKKSLTSQSSGGCSDLTSNVKTEKNELRKVINDKEDSTYFNRGYERKLASTSQSNYATSKKMMASRTYSNYNEETGAATHNNADMKAIKLPKRFLSYYMGDHVKDSGNKRVHAKRKISGKKDLPSFSNIQREVNQVQNNFLTKSSVNDKSHPETRVENPEIERKDNVLLQPPLPPIAVDTGHCVMIKPSPVRPRKDLRFSVVEFRFFAYSTGGGVPSDGGPSLGLHGSVIDTLKMDIEIFEDFRGGILPEDDDVDDDEEWNDNWRLPREYFVDRGGHLPVQERIDLLKCNGVRRCSIDLSSHLSKLTISSRQKNSRSKAPRLLIEGVDPDEVTIQLEKWEATQKLEPLLVEWARQWSTIRSRM